MPAWEMGSLACTTTAILEPTVSPPFLRLPALFHPSASGHSTLTSRASNSAFPVGLPVVFLVHWGSRVARWGEGGPPMLATVSVWASALPASLPIEPGEEATMDLAVRNLGTVVDEFRFEILGDVARWAEVSPRTLNLLPGAEGRATVHLRPPRLPSTPAGAVPFGVRVISEDDPAGTLTRQTVVQVSCYPALSVTAVPQTSHGRRSGQHTVTVKNEGNCSVRVQTTCSDPDEHLSFSATPSPVDVGPAATETVVVTVRARQRLLRGKPRPKPFELTVVGGPEPVGLERVFVQKPIFPGWLLALIVVLAGVVLVLAIQQPLPVAIVLVFVILVLLAAALLLGVFLMVRALFRRRST